MSEVSDVPVPSLDGRRFAPVADVTGGDVGAGTVFEYAEADGRLRMHETWAWESQDGAGTSVVEEVM